MVMARSRRFNRVVGSLCLTAAALVLFWPGGLTPLDPKPTQSGEPMVGVEGPVDEKVAKQIAVVRHKSALKEVVLNNLMTGELKLPEAVACFQRIEAEYPDHARPMRWHIEYTYPNCRFEEGLARDLLVRVQQQLHDQPERVRAVLPRLEAELAAYVGQ
jgi:hypothetical protein